MAAQLAAHVQTATAGFKLGHTLADMRSMEPNRYSEGAASMPPRRYWKVHLTADPPEHWITVDCGEPVSEPRAVYLTEIAYAHTGRVPVTAALPSTDYPY